MSDPEAVAVAVTMPSAPASGTNPLATAAGRLVISAFASMPWIVVPANARLPAAFSETPPLPFKSASKSRRLLTYFPEAASARPERPAVLVWRVAAFVQSSLKSTTGSVGVPEVTAVPEIVPSAPRPGTKPLAIFAGRPAMLALTARSRIAVPTDRHAAICLQKRAIIAAEIGVEIDPVVFIFASGLGGKAGESVALRLARCRICPGQIEGDCRCRQRAGGRRLAGNRAFGAQIGNEAVRKAGWKVCEICIDLRLRTAVPASSTLPVAFSDRALRSGEVGIEIEFLVGKMAALPQGPVRSGRRSWCAVSWHPAS